MPSTTTGPAPARGRVSGGPSRTLELVETAAWTQAVLRRYAAATNLSLASTPVLVHGAGPIGGDLALRLRATGARVRVSSADPVALLALRGRGVAVEHRDRARVDPAVAVVFATGEEPEPLDPRDVVPAGAPLVIVDAARPGSRPGVVAPRGAASAGTGAGADRSADAGTSAETPAVPGAVAPLAGPTSGGAAARPAYLVVVGADASAAAAGRRIRTARAELAAEHPDASDAELDALLAEGELARGGRGWTA